MTTPSSIEELVQTLKPVRRLPHYGWRFFRWFCVSVIVVVLVIFNHGLRADYATRLHHIDFWIEISIAIGIFMLSGVLAMRQNVPRTDPIWISSLLGAPVLAWLLFMMNRLLHTHDLASFSLEQSFPCAYIMFNTAFVPVTLFILLIIRGASSHPLLTSFAAALGAGGAAALAIRLICPMETVGHLVIWHVGPFMAIVLIGTLLGALFKR